MSHMRFGSAVTVMTIGLIVHVALLPSEARSLATVNATTARFPEVYYVSS
jgi:hypothetical protein